MTVAQASPTGRLDGPPARRSTAASTSAEAVDLTIVQKRLIAGRHYGQRQSRIGVVSVSMLVAAPKRHQSLSTAKLVSVGGSLAGPRQKRNTAAIDTS